MLKVRLVMLLWLKPAIGKVVWKQPAPVPMLPLWKDCTVMLVGLLQYPAHGIELFVVVVELELVWLAVSPTTAVAWMLNCWLVEPDEQSSTSMAAPAEVLLPRTVMQRPVEAAATVKAPFWATGAMLNFCELAPLQELSTRPVPLVAAPASTHLLVWPS